MLLESVIKIMVSSAKRTILLYLGIIFGKSFIYVYIYSGSSTQHPVLKGSNLILVVTTTSNCSNCHVLLHNIVWNNWIT